MDVRKRFDISKIKDILIVVFIGTLIYDRVVGAAETVAWIGLVSYIGVIVALGSLFADCINTYIGKRNIGVFIIFCIVVAIILTIKMARIAEGKELPTNIDNDVYTLLALLISLPQKLYVSLIGLVLPKRRNDNE